MLEARGLLVLAMMERLREQMMLARAKRLKDVQKLREGQTDLAICHKGTREISFAGTRVRCRASKRRRV
jgi:hypothetical protein